MTQQGEDAKDPTFDEKMDNVLDEAGVHDPGVPTPEEVKEEPKTEDPPQEPSPETDQPAVKEEAGTDPEKTDSTPDNPDEFKGVPEGFNNHPAWQKLQGKVKEAEARQEELERNNRSYESLLNDPETFERYYKRQGYSEHEIGNMMRDKGMTNGSQREQDVFESAAQELGYDLQSLKPEEVDYLKNLAKFSEKVADLKIKKTFDPIQQQMNLTADQQRLKAQIDNVQKLAEADGYTGKDGFQLVQTAMTKKLTEMDQQAGKQVAISPENLYYRTIHELRSDKQTLADRQASRDEKKSISRPLVPSGASVKTDSNKNYKGKTASEITDEFLDGVGYRG